MPSSDPQIVEYESQIVNIDAEMSASRSRFIKDFAAEIAASLQPITRTIGEAQGEASNKLGIDKLKALIASVDQEAARIRSEGPALFDQPELWDRSTSHSSNYKYDNTLRKIPGSAKRVFGVAIERLIEPFATLLRRHGFKTSDPYSPGYHQHSGVLSELSSYKQTTDLFERYCNLWTQKQTLLHEIAKRRHDITQADAKALWSSATSGK